MLSGTPVKTTFEWQIMPCPDAFDGGFHYASWSREIGEGRPGLTLLCRSRSTSKQLAHALGGIDFTEEQ
ncbi:MAG: hypothetical protein NVS4B2_23830 [Chloroflexota bacterium]